MTIRRISFHLDFMTGDALSALRMACGVAAGFQAKLWVLAYPSEPHGEPPSDVAWEETRSMALRVAQDSGADVEVVDRSSFAYGIGDVFADCLRVSDLGIMLGDPVLTVAQRMMLNAALFSGARPILLWPRGREWVGRLKRPLVGWDATPAAARALTASVPFANLADDIVVASVASSTEVRLGQSGVEAVRYLAMHGARASFKVISGNSIDALPTLEAAAHEQDSDLLCVGAVRHAPIRDLIFGGVTQSILNKPSRLPVLLSA